MTPIDLILAVLCFTILAAILSVLMYASLQRGKD